METVEVVIKIPKKVLERIQSVANGSWGRKNLDALELAILDGILLPKGHGDLKGEWGRMTNPDKYLIAVYDAENNQCFLIYESTICPQLNTQLYFPHLGLYNVEKVVYHVSDDHSKPDYEELMFIDVIVSKVDWEGNKA